MLEPLRFNPERLIGVQHGPLDRNRNRIVIITSRFL